MRASLNLLHDVLLKEYGDLGWWPAEDPFEVAVGARLTQNTSWGNVELAIDALRRSGALSPSHIAQMDCHELESLVRPSGFFRQKARYVKGLAVYLEERYSGDILALSSMSMEEVREELLNLRGIGPETADSIMLYALRMPSFVVDSYTLRLLRRLGIAQDDDYDSVKTGFEQTLDHDVDKLANAHAMIVIHCKTVCRAKPACAHCVLFHMCSEAEEQEERIADERC